MCVLLHGCALQGLPSFEHDRAKTDRESTTMLSPWIHFGSISVRHIYYRVAQKHAEWQAAGVDKGRSCLDFLQQMGYREYSRWVWRQGNAAKLCAAVPVCV